MNCSLQGRLRSVVSRLKPRPATNSRTASGSVAPGEQPPLGTQGVSFPRLSPSASRPSPHRLVHRLDCTSPKARPQLMPVRDIYLLMISGNGALSIGPLTAGAEYTGPATLLYFPPRISCVSRTAP